MLSKMRKRISYTNIALVVALILATSSGAYAAGRYVITSTSQIKPSVRKALQGQTGPAGKTGPAGQAGANGTAGAQGPAGSQGTAGTNGTNGTNGEPGEKGHEGKEGPEGSPWTAGGVLPPEKTETGTWAYGAREKTLVLVHISFPIPLKNAFAESSVHWVSHGAPTSECPGSPAKPEALPGNLCVYGNESSGKVALATPHIIDPSLSIAEQGAATAGAVLLFGEVEEEEAFGIGTWAVTAEKEK
jgi:hypothetical protein